jgi:hypothetical protein
MTDMQTIQQEGVTTTRNVSLAPRNRDFFDDFEPAGFGSRSKYVFRITHQCIITIYSLVMMHHHREIMIDMMMIMIKSTCITDTNYTYVFSNKISRIKALP